MNLQCHMIIGKQSTSETKTSTTDRNIITRILLALMVYRLKTMTKHPQKIRFTTRQDPRKRGAMAKRKQ